MWQPLNTKTCAVCWQEKKVNAKSFYKLEDWTYSDTCIKCELEEIRVNKSECNCEECNCSDTELLADYIMDLEDEIVDCEEEIWKLDASLESTDRCVYKLTRRVIEDDDFYFKRTMVSLWLSIIALILSLYAIAN